jgi:hypothetical protein
MYESIVCFLFCYYLILNFDHWGAEKESISIHFFSFLFGIAAASTDSNFVFVLSQRF